MSAIRLKLLLRQRARLTSFVKGLLLVLCWSLGGEVFSAHAVHPSLPASAAGPETLWPALTQPRTPSQHRVLSPHHWTPQPPPGHPARYHNQLQSIQVNPDGKSLNLLTHFQPDPSLGAGFQSAELWQRLEPRDTRQEAGQDLRNQRLRLEVVLPPELPSPPEHATYLEVVLVMAGPQGETGEARLRVLAPRHGGQVTLHFPFTEATWRRATTVGAYDRWVYLDETGGTPFLPVRGLAVGLRLLVPAQAPAYEGHLQLLEAALEPILAAAPVGRDRFLAASGVNAFWGHADVSLDKYGFWVGNTLDERTGFAAQRAELRHILQGLAQAGVKLVRVPLLVDLRGGVVARDDQGHAVGLAAPERFRDDLQALLDEVRAAELRLVPVLLSFELGDGETGPFRGEHPEDITQAPARAAFLQTVLRPIVQQLAEPANAPWVAAVDLFNEPDGELATRLPIGAVQRFVREAAALIHALPGRPLLVTVGFRTLTHALQYGTHLDLDLLQAHSYADTRATDPLDVNLGEYGLGEGGLGEGGLGEVGSTGAGRADKSPRQQAGLPLMLWELGSPGTPAALRQVLEAAYASGVSGFAFYADDRKFLFTEVEKRVLQDFAHTDTGGRSNLPSRQRALHQMPGLPGEGFSPDTHHTLSPKLAQMAQHFPALPGVGLTSDGSGLKPYCLRLWLDDRLPEVIPLPSSPSDTVSPLTSCLVPEVMDRLAAAVLVQGRQDAQGTLLVYPAEFTWLYCRYLPPQPTELWLDPQHILSTQTPALLELWQRTFRFDDAMQTHLLTAFSNQLLPLPTPTEAQILSSLQALKPHDAETLLSLYLGVQKVRANLQLRADGQDDEALLPVFLLAARFCLTLDGREPGLPLDADALGAMLSWLGPLSHSAGSLAQLKRTVEAGQGLHQALLDAFEAPVNFRHEPEAAGKLLYWAQQVANMPETLPVLTSLTTFRQSPELIRELSLLRPAWKHRPLAQKVDLLLRFLVASGERIARGSLTEAQARQQVAHAVNVYLAHQGRTLEPQSSARPLWAGLLGVFGLALWTLLGFLQRPGAPNRPSSERHHHA